MATRDEVPFRGTIRGPPKIPRLRGALPYSKIWWSDSDGSSSDDEGEGAMGNYYEIGDESKYFMSLEEYYALQEAANNTCFHTLTHCFAVLKRSIFGCFS